MSDYDAINPIEDVPEVDTSAEAPPFEESWEEPVAPPAPDLPEAADAEPILPPHEQPDAGLVPPVPEPPVDTPLGDAPPAPPATPDGLPPELPEVADGVDLSGGEMLAPEATADAPPMPPVEGDTTAPPPGASVDLGDGGPPLPPDVPAAEPGADLQSPVPNMGGPVPDDGQPPIELGDDGPPMPPIGDADTTTPPPGADVPGADVPVIDDPDSEIVDESVLVVDPGDERVAAAALTGVVLDQMGYDDTARTQMIDLLEGYAADGTITAAEVEAAMLQFGMDQVIVDPTEATLDQVLSSRPVEGHLATATIEGEGTCVVQIRAAGGQVELESLQTGSVYSASPAEVTRAWRDSSSSLLAPPIPAPLPLEAVADTSPAPAADDPADNRLRNALIAGAVLLPLAGGGTYLATRKIR